MKLFLTILLVFVIFILAIAIGANNDQIVTFNYLFAKNDFKLSFLLAALFGFGFIISWVISLFFYLKLRTKLVFTERKLRKLQREYEHNLTASSKPVLETEHKND